MSENCQKAPKYITKNLGHKNLLNKCAMKIHPKNSREVRGSAIKLFDLTDLKRSATAFSKKGGSEFRNIFGKI